MTQQVDEVGEPSDELEHFGVPGMKWGKRKIAASKARNASIDGARARQGNRAAEIKGLTAKRITETSTKGKDHLDRKIADKKFELKNHDDAVTARQLKSGEKVLKGVKITAMLGLGVVGLGSAVSIVNSEMNKADNEAFPKSFKEIKSEGSTDYYRFDKDGNWGPSH